MNKQMILFPNSLLFPNSHSTKDLTSDLDYAQELHYLFNARVLSPVLIAASMKYLTNIHLLPFSYTLFFTQDNSKWRSSLDATYTIIMFNVSEGKRRGKERKKASFTEREDLPYMSPAFLLNKAKSTLQKRCFIFTSSKEVGLAMNLPYSYVITSEVFDNFFLDRP